MSAFGGPNIITDGLVLNLDAGNSKSYPGSGTTWFDKSGFGNNGTLINGPTFNTGNGGGIVFDGVDDYVRIPENDILKTDSTGAFTRISWFNMTEDRPNTFNNVIWHRRTIIGINQNVSAVGAGINNEVYTYIGGNYTGTGVLRNLNTWYHVAVTYQNTSVTIYVNGVLKNNSTRTLESQSGINFDIGASNTSNYFTGDISTVVGYSRALSASEVLQNYNATKGRFGLL
jgi:hypothetical protein